MPRTEERGDRLQLRKGVRDRLYRFQVAKTDRLQLLRIEATRAYPFYPSSETRNPLRLEMASRFQYHSQSQSSFCRVLTRMSSVSEIQQCSGGACILR